MSRQTCSVCFREFLTDERGRLFRHVRVLGHNTRCPGSRFEPAGLSLSGTLWAIDVAAGSLSRLVEQLDKLQSRPILAGIGPFDALYDTAWDEIVNSLEHRRAALLAELGELTTKYNEWRRGAPVLGPTPFHIRSLWLSRAGADVPLCFSIAARRPSGDPILVDPSQSDCPFCLAVSEV